MRYSLAILMAAAIIVPSLSSGGGGEEKVNVVVSVSDFIPLVKAVGGSFVEVNSILPPGSDPHSFYITQDTVKQIENADIIVLANSRLLSYETNIKENYPEKRYLDFDDYNVTLDSFPGYGANPHGYWLKFENALAIAEKIRDELSELRPSEREYFNSSFARLELEVTGAREDIRRISDERG
ncbi:MAG: zinc ABC transporter substrate-binding protein, partial [Deltaproteobacteria bacterium]|nr:zinc ABC transporter substrate-binding protein [Deltaproteobacteria bacterium]